MAVETRQRSPQEGEQKPLGYLVLNGELLRGPFDYAITDANEVTVNGRRVHPRVSRFPSDPTEDYEIENIKARAASRIEGIEVVAFSGLLYEAGEDIRSRMVRLAETEVNLVQRKRAFDALVEINTALELGSSKVIMEGDAAEYSFTDRGEVKQERIRKNKRDIKSGSSR